MFYHAVHLLNHGSALESGTLGLHGAQFCALAGDRDAGVVCTCASRVLSCPEPSIVGTTKGLHVDLPQLGNKASVKAFLAKHPNNAYLVMLVPDCACTSTLRALIRPCAACTSTSLRAALCVGLPALQTDFLLRRGSTTSPR